ncbi:MAG: sulfite exporter TauE/SafE family protein [Verrucomicrobiales bacterium]|nr:sulfite exporter TauE/SafE family protein [Verrucomicrobiales bacterium]
MKIIILGVLIGVLGGMVAALCGVGGGIVMVPAFVFLLGMEQKHAVATSMAVIAPTAFMAILRFTGANYVQWKIFWPTAIGAVIAAYFTVDLMKRLSNVHLTRIFAVILIVIGVSMLFKRA